MTFLFPLGLLALLALPIIVLLHLIRERRRRVVVPSLLLWQHLPQQPSAQQRRRLPLTLLLLLHLLVAACLGLALAQPQWLGALLGRGTHLALIIDTSTSMAARGDGLSNQTRLEQARARARTLIDGLGGSDTIALIAAGAQAQLLEVGSADRKAALNAALDSLRAGGTGTDIIGALTLAEAALDAYPDGRVVVLSDSALPNLAGELAERTPTLPVTWEQIGTDIDNRAVVALAARSWSSSTVGADNARAAVQVYARVVNYGSAPLATEVQLFGDEQPLGSRPVNLSADGEAELTWTLPPGVRTLRVELAGRDNLPDDDSASLSLFQNRPINTLLVSATPERLERALTAVAGLNVAVISPVEYGNSSLAADADLTVFEGVLPERWPAGGVLVINPPIGAGPLLNVAANPAPVNAEQPAPVLLPSVFSSALEGVSLGGINFGALRSVEVPAWATVVMRSGDTPLILRGQSGQSNIAIWTFDLVESGLTTRLAFPLLVARTVRDLTPPALPSAVLAGDTLPLRPSPRAATLELRAPDGAVQQLPLAAPEQAGAAVTLMQPGVYTLVERQGDTAIYTGQVAVNAGAPVESDLRPRPVPAGLDGSPPAGQQSGSASRDQRDQQSLWPWLIGLALVLMLLEWGYVHRK